MLIRKLGRPIWAWLGLYLTPKADHAKTDDKIRAIVMLFALKMLTSSQHSIWCLFVCFFFMEVFLYAHPLAISGWVKILAFLPEHPK